MNKINIFLIIMSIFSTTFHSAFSQSVYTYKVGSDEVSLLSEVQNEGKPGILIGVTPEIIEKYIPKGTYPSAVNAFLIKTPDKNILVDTGFGTKLFDNLKSLGISPEQIDIVLLTHMHGDHIGGMLHDGKVAFPNAEVYIAHPEYRYWTDKGSEGQINVFNAYREKLHFFQPNEIDARPTDLLPGIKAIAAYGHTPGHTAFLIESNNSRLLIWGDLAHAMAVQMPHPEIAVTYDVNPQDAVKYRKKILSDVSEKKIPIAGMHIAIPGMGTVAATPAGGYVFTPFN